MLKYLWPIWLIPAILFVIGVMFILGWNQESNPNSWWTEVRKEQAEEREAARQATLPSGVKSPESNL